MTANIRQFVCIIVLKIACKQAIIESEKDNSLKKFCHNSKVIGISVYSHPDDVIATNFCTCHGSCVVMPFANI